MPRNVGHPMGLRHPASREKIFDRCASRYIGGLIAVHLDILSMHDQARPIAVIALRSLCKAMTAI